MIGEPKGFRWRRGGIVSAESAEARSMSGTVYPNPPDTLGKGPAAAGGSAAADKRKRSETG